MAIEAGLSDCLPTRYIRNSMCNACYNLMSNAVIVDFLKELSRDLDFAQRVAYARIFYLGETRMAELIGLKG
jgi:hypothetical protein